MLKAMYRFDEPHPFPEKKFSYQTKHVGTNMVQRAIMYRGIDKSLARPTSRCILFDGENISFDASLVIRYKNYISQTGHIYFSC